MRKSLVLVALFAATGLSTNVANAQNAREAQMLGYHSLCNQGDRRACIRFGIMMEQNKVMLVAWRRAHADWFWYEH